MLDLICLVWDKKIEIFHNSQARNHFSETEWQALAGNIDMQEEKLERKIKLLDCYSVAEHHSTDDKYNSGPCEHWEKDWKTLDAS